MMCGAEIGLVPGMEGNVIDTKQKVTWQFQQ